MGFLMLVALIYLFIMVTFVLATLRSQASLLSQGAFGPLSLGRLRFDWRQLKGFSDGIYFTWLKNSALISFGGAVIAVLVALPAGYALAMLHFRGRRVLLFLTILTMVMPNTVLVIPLFLEVSAVHQVDVLWPVAVIMGFFPFGTYLSFVHYRTTLPYEMLEAGRIDGVTEMGLFWRVATPLAKQAVALGFLFRVRRRLDQLLPSARDATYLCGPDGVRRSSGVDHVKSAFQRQCCCGAQCSAVHAGAGIRGRVTDAPGSSRVRRSPALPPKGRDARKRQGLTAQSGHHS